MMTNVIDEKLKVLQEKRDIVPPNDVTNLSQILSKFEFDTKDCPVKNITVFVDRAEVSRTMEIEINKGDLEVLLKGLPECVDQDSVRVSCYGEATINEVAYQEKTVKDESDEEIAKTNTEAEIQDIKKSLKAFALEKEKLKNKQDVITSQKQLLQRYADQLTNNKENKVGDLLDRKSVDDMLHFLTVHEERTHQINQDLLEINQSIENIDKEINVLKENLENLQPKHKSLRKQRNVSILLEGKVNGKIILVASYVVFNASWSPLYDVRAFNKDSTVQILYFGMIKQNTGEDWENAKLSLSTAMPSIGGNPPPLKPMTISVQEVQHFKKAKFKRSIRRTKAAPPPPPMENDYCLKSAGLFDSDEDSTPSLAAMPTAKATENLTSTNFDIVRPATIESDNVGHKVSICQLDLSPEFNYSAIPKSVSHAFLKIKVKNESNYALLPGDANIFLDNNFLTKSSLPSVSPMEEFECSLGVDPSVKVDYKPLKKFQQRTGVISKSEVVNYHQNIEIKNTKSNTVKITVIDQCPRSTNEKIKVILQEPDIKLPNKVWNSSETSKLKHGNATLSTNSYEIEWIVDIPPSETKTITLKYQVEHPLGVDVVWS